MRCKGCPRSNEMYNYSVTQTFQEKTMTMGVLKALRQDNDEEENEENITVPAPYIERGKIQSNGSHWRAIYRG